MQRRKGVWSVPSVQPAGSGILWCLFGRGHVPQACVPWACPCGRSSVHSGRPESGETSNRGLYGARLELLEPQTGVQKRPGWVINQLHRQQPVLDPQWCRPCRALLQEFLSCDVVFVKVLRSVRGPTLARHLMVQFEPCSDASVHMALPSCTLPPPVPFQALENLPTGRPSSRTRASLCVNRMLNVKSASRRVVLSSRDDLGTGGSGEHIALAPALGNAAPAPAVYNALGSSGGVQLRKKRRSSSRFGSRSNEMVCAYLQVEKEIFDVRRRLLRNMVFAWTWNKNGCSRATRLKNRPWMCQ